MTDLRTRCKLLRHETILAAPAGRRAGRPRRPVSDRFFTVDNLLNQGRLMTEVGLVALPMTFVIVTGGIDLSVGSILGLTRDPARRLLAEPRPAAAGRHRAGDRRRRRRRPRQRPDHHPLQGAAADRDAGHARALSRPRRGHQPGALGARLSGLVLRARPGRGARRADAALDLRSSSRSSPPVVLGLTHLRPRHLRHRHQRDRGALLRHHGRPHQASRSTPPPASSRRSPR